jgi:hypothetical protein
LTKAFSKKLENLAAAVALHFMYNNSVRIQQTLRVTPAMAAVVMNRLWSIEDSGLVGRCGAHLAAGLSRGMSPLTRRIPGGRLSVPPGKRVKKGVCFMAHRKQFQKVPDPDPELMRLWNESRNVTEEELREQRVSFAFGNAPVSSYDRITKDSVRTASTHIRLQD